MLQYEICNLILNIDCDNSLLVQRIQDFLVSDYRKADLAISLRSQDLINIPEGKIIADENIKWLQKPSGQDGYLLYTTEKSLGRLLTLADIDSDWRNGSIKYFNNENKSDEDNYKIQTEIYVYVLMGVMFRYSLFHHGGIVIHASALEWKGKGILFSAPSGTGKSTHVKLWQEYMGKGVKVLNDDTPAIRFKADQPYVYGTPWSGSSQIHCNGNAPVEAIVLLEQSGVNSIHPLSTQEAILKLMPRAFLPYFDQNMMNKALDIFERVVSSVPVYLLQCRPDREAVELAYQCLK